MSEATGTPLAPKKTSPWVIAILVIVVVCCGCFGVTGLLFAFFGDQILQALGISALLPVLAILA